MLLYNRISINIDTFRYDLPMMFGLVVMFFSTLLFAVGSSYSVLFLARSVQGVGSAFADTGGLSMIADRYSKQTSNGKLQHKKQAAYCTHNSMGEKPLGLAFSF